MITRDTPEIEREREERAPTRFREDANRAVGSLRQALEGVVAGARVRWDVPSQLATELRISKNLAWKLARVMTESDAMAALPLVPGKDAFEILIKKASARGVPSEVMESLRSALDQIETLVTTHAGDRATLEVLAAGCGGDKESSLALNLRKAAFLGNGFMWGVQAKAQYKLSVLRRSRAIPTHADMVMISGLVGLRANRPISSWVLARTRTYDDLATTSDGGPRPSISAIDPRVPPGGAPLLNWACSSPLPEVVSSAAPDGCIEHRLSSWQVGDTGAVTCFTGELVRQIGELRRTENNRYASSIARLHTPTELLVFDLLVERDMFAGQAPEFELLSDLGFPLSTGIESERRMDITGRQSRLGSSLALASCREVPRCTELVQQALDALGTSATEFEFHRVELRYPPVAASAMLKFTLPS